MNARHPLQIELEQRGMMHVDGRDPVTGQQFSRNLTMGRIVLKSPQHDVTIDFTKEGTYSECFEEAIERIENMLEGMKALKTKHIPPTI